MGVFQQTVNLQVGFALLLAAAPFAATAQPTNIFTDNFGNGSTLNGTSTPGGTPTASSTSYDIASTKNASSGPAIASGDLTLKLNATTTSGFLEAQALFTSTPFALNVVGDYINLTYTFTNTGGTLLAGGTGSYLYTGLYNSGGYTPVAGGALDNSGLNTTATTYATGNAANWQGYVARISSGGTSQMITRPVQNGSTNLNNACQDLVGNNVGGGAYDNPAGTPLTGGNETATVTLTANAQYTISCTLALTAAGTITITNNLYSGVGTGGTLIFSQTNSASGATFLTNSFDGLAIGMRNNGTTFNPTMDIYSIVISGQSSIVTNPPTITLQPASVTVATNGSCAFFVSATGIGVSYHWRRNGTNLLDGGNISGSTSSMLVISPAGPADVLSGANGYYVTVSGTGGYSTNSVTNSLALTTATNLIWYANVSTTWDVNNSANWQDTNGNQTVFNYGNPVAFTDLNGHGTVILTGPYLGAASVTVNSAGLYNFSAASTGGFAGPGQLIYTGTGGLTIGNANTYTGGTLISNTPTTQGLLLQNLNGLGTGPVTLALAGGKMEVVPTGSATLGINGDVVVADDFTIQFDGTGSYAGVFLGNLSGTVGKTLTFVVPAANTSTNERIRVYGANITNNANLALASLITFAPYNGSGSQTYNGVISGAGAIMEKGTTTYLNGSNTYSGGTFPVSGAIGLGIDSTGNPVSSGPVGTGPLYLTVDSTTTTTGSGTVFASGGAHTIANSIQFPTGTNNLTLIIGGTNNLTFSGAFTLNGNDNITTNTITARTVEVTNTGLTTISGVISDGGLVYGFIKTGGGTLALNNTEIYTGPTTVSAGTLQVNGQLAAASAVTVSTNATLAGTGTINGTVAVNAGGALAPGAASIGTLTINSNLTLAGNVNVRVNRSGFSSDEAVVSGGITNTGTGTVTVTNLGLPLQVNDTFTLFNKAVTNGNALTVTGAGMNWTNKLAINGTIAVLSPVVATNSTNITFSVNYSGGVPASLTLSWPSDHTGWTLLAQTNSLAVGLTNNWAPVAGSTGEDQVTIPINGTNGAVFFRMAYPYP